MKKQSIKKALLLLAFAVFGTVSSGAQTMSDIHERGQALIDYLMEQDREVVHVEYDLIFSENKEVFRTLSKGYTYIIVAFADEGRVSDLDLYVYRKVNGQWVEIDHDAKTDATPIVSVKPETTGQYKFVVKVYSYKEGKDRSCWGIIMAHDD